MAISDTIADRLNAAAQAMSQILVDDIFKTSPLMGHLKSREWSATTLFPGPTKPPKWMMTMGRRLHSMGMSDETIKLTLTEVRKARRKEERVKEHAQRQARKELRTRRR